MHLTALAVLPLLAALPAGLCLAKESAEEIWLSSKDNAAVVSGGVGGHSLSAGGK